MDISLDTDAGTLFGTLLRPPRGSVHPVVLILAGSGPTDRDGNSPLLTERNDCLKLVAEALKNAGVASVRHDKRGVAASVSAAPDESALRIDTYAQDVAAWINMLRRDTRFSSIGLVGHSEGSLIGMLAMQLVSVDAFVSVAGPAENAATLLRKQLNGKLDADLQNQSEKILASLEAGRQVDNIPSELLALYRESVQPYLISWFKRTPTIELAKLSTPVQIINGTADEQVGIEQAEMLKRAKPDAELVFVPGMNHLLRISRPVRANLKGRQTNAPEPLASSFIEHLSRFLLASLTSQK